MSAFDPVEQLSKTIWGAPLRHDATGETERGGAEQHHEGVDPLRVLMTVGGLAHGGSEFAHAAGQAGHVAHGAPRLGMTNVLAPFALLSGMGHIQHSLHDKEGLEKVANVAAGGAEAISGGIGTMGLAGHALNAVGLRGAGSALTALAGSSLLSGLGAVGGAFAAGWSVGTLLDETFGLSDKLSGPGAIEQAGMVETKQRGTPGIADSNQRWVVQEVERLRDESGERSAEAVSSDREEKESPDGREAAHPIGASHLRHAKGDRTATGDGRAVSNGPAPLPHARDAR